MKVLMGFFKIIMYSFVLIVLTALSPIIVFGFVLKSIIDAEFKGKENNIYKFMKGKNK